MFAGEETRDSEPEAAGEETRDSEAGAMQGVPDRRHLVASRHLTLTLNLTLTRTPEP